VLNKLQANISPKQQNRQHNSLTSSNWLIPQHSLQPFFVHLQDN